MRNLSVFDTSLHVRLIHIWHVWMNLHSRRALQIRFGVASQNFYRPPPIYRLCRWRFPVESASSDEMPVARREEISKRLHEIYDEEQTMRWMEHDVWLQVQSFGAAARSYQLMFSAPVVISTECFSIFTIKCIYISTVWALLYKWTKNRIMQVQNIVEKLLKKCFSVLKYNLSIGPWCLIDMRKNEVWIKEISEILL